ncbi:MAG: helix-turn-helix domain-containing protein, partial [Pseudonocardia sediminis]
MRDIARRTGLPRSTCHALCSTLVAEKMLELRPGGGYVLGVELMVLGTQVMERSGLVDAAVPAMNGLAASTGSEIRLGQLHDTSIVYLHRIRATRRVGADDRFGLRLPAHLTGCGRAAMSAMDAAAARRLAASGGVEPGSVDRLMAELLSARTRGFVVSTSPAG